MTERDKHLIKSYLSNLNVSVLLAGYGNVGPKWKNLDYIPEYNKLYFICDGEGWLKIGNKEYYPVPGQIFLMPQGIKQSFSTINENTFVKYWCHFTASVGDMNIFDIVKLPPYIDAKETAEFESIFKELLKSYNSMEISASLFLKSAILRLLSFYIDHSAELDMNISHSESIEKLSSILQYIERNLRQDITVRELSDIAHLHPNYFIRLFKRHLGTTPIQYINKMRIEEAKRLLLTTDYTMTEICERIGIANSYYLSKLFKGNTGFSPTVYKDLETTGAGRYEKPAGSRR